MRPLRQARTSTNQNCPLANKIIHCEKNRNVLWWQREMELNQAVSCVWLLPTAKSSRIRHSRACKREGKWTTGKRMLANAKRERGEKLDRWRQRNGYSRARRGIVPLLTATYTRAKKNLTNGYNQREKNKASRTRASEEMFVHDCAFVSAKRQEEQKLTRGDNGRT